MNYTISFTRTQISEIFHKIEVMECDGCSEGNMAHHYGFTDHSLQELRAKFVAVLGRLRAKVTLDVREAAAVYGELDNALDIAKDNIDYYDPDCEHRKLADRLKDGMRRMREAVPKPVLESRLC